MDLLKRRTVLYLCTLKTQLDDPLPFKISCTNTMLILNYNIGVYALNGKGTCMLVVVVYMGSVMLHFFKVQSPIQLEGKKKFCSQIYGILHCCSGELDAVEN